MIIEHLTTMKYFAAYAVLLNKSYNCDCSKDLLTIIDRNNKARIFPNLAFYNDSSDNNIPYEIEMQYTPAAVMMLLALTTALLQKVNIAQLVA